MSWSAVFASTGIMLPDTNVAKESPVYHGHAPYIIVAKSEGSLASCNFRRDGKLAPDKYKERISSKDAGQIPT